MELIIDSGMLRQRLVQPLLDEANELVAIIVASRKTVKKRSG
jgi:hypothetical protein